MKIYLVRHGEAVSPQIDPEIPLSPQGREDIEKIARLLGENSFPFSHVLYSEKLRARQTAEIFTEFISPGTPMEEHFQLNPNDPIQEILARIDAEETDMMIVGHLPFLEKLVGYLVTGHEEEKLINFQTGTIACLESSEGSWVINWVIGIDQV